MRSMKRLTAANPGTVISSPACFNSREHIIGVSVSDTTADVTTAIVSVNANSRNMRPTSPDMNSSGMKTAISDTVSEITVKPISLAPFSDASIADSPFSMWRTMFSIITMASSTTKPVPIVSALSERLSRPTTADNMRTKLARPHTGREIHDAEPRDHRQRQRPAGDQRRPQRPQEQQHHQRHQHHAQDQRELDVVN